MNPFFLLRHVGNVATLYLPAPLHPHTEPRQGEQLDAIRCLSKGKDQPHTLTPLSILKDVSAVQWGNAAVFLRTHISPDLGCMWIKDMGGVRVPTCSHKHCDRGGALQT